MRPGGVRNDRRMQPDHETVLVKVRLERLTPQVDAVDVAAAALWAEGATAVEVRDDADGSTLLAGFPTAAAARCVAEILRGSLGAIAETVTDTTWQEAWKAWVHPVAVGEGLLVVPAWREVVVDSGRLQLQIDSGACFGSGTHPSTRMLLAWLDLNRPVGARVLDVGAGSGILAVAAAALGARSVTAVDIDPASVAVTEANALRNGVAAKVSASTTSVADLADGCAEVVMVNVTAGTHAEIGSDCARKVSTGGVLLVAGLLPGQWGHIADRYGELTLVEPLRLEGWEGAVLLAGRSVEPTQL